MNKLTTDRLVSWFEEFCSAANDLSVGLGRKGFDQEDVFIKHSIIAKLRAVDKLVAVMKRGEPYAPALVRREFETAIKEFEGAGS